MTVKTLPFKQVDVFSPVATKGNPVAVVLDSSGISDKQMKDFASWTNLSEATFFVDAKDESADYALRIFSHQNEFAFAGHPTLGSAYAWLETGGKPKGNRIRQESAIGVVEIQQIDGKLYFATPPLLRSGAIDSSELEQITRALGLEKSEVIASNWLDNGPGWRGLLLTSAELVNSVIPNGDLLSDLNVGIAGPYPVGSDFAYEVRAFFQTGSGLGEDPITGSLNGAFGQWLIAEGLAPAKYVAHQGTNLGRDGQVSVFRDNEGQVWVGGHCQTVISGQVAI